MDNIAEFVSEYLPEMVFIFAMIQSVLGLLDGPLKQCLEVFIQSIGG